MNKAPWLVGFLLPVFYFSLAAVIHSWALLILIPLFVGAIAFYKRSSVDYFCAFLFLLPFFGGLQELLKLKGLPLAPVFILGPFWQACKKPFPISGRIFLMYFGTLLLSLVVGISYSFLDYQAHQSLAQLAHHVGWNFLFFLIPMTGLVFFHLVVRENFSDVQLRTMFVWFLKGMIGCVVIASMQYFGVFDLNSNWRVVPAIEGRFNGTFLDSNVLGFVTGICIILCLSLWSIERRGWLSGFIPALFFLLYLSGSRSGFIIVVVSIVPLFLFLKSWRIKLGLLVLILASSVVISFLFQRDIQKGRGVRIVHETRIMVSAVADNPAPDPIQSEKTIASARPAPQPVPSHRLSFVGRGVNYILASRRVLWSLAIRVIKDHWLFGVGLGRYLVVAPRYTYEDLNDNACNMYLQVAAEQGIIGAVIFLLMLGGVFWSFRDFKKQSLFQFAAFSSFVGVLVAFVFGSHIVNSEANIVFWFLIAVMGARVEYRS